MRKPMIIDNWHGCYKKGWKGTLTAEAFVHPAKVAFSLAERIYQHLFEEGWLQSQSGDTVVDPFGGIAGCGLHAALKGCHFIGCELEERFVRLGNANIEKWRGEYSRLPGYGSIRLVQGDSRELVKVIEGDFAAAISSPPYADGCAHTGGNTPTSAEHMHGDKLYGVGIQGVVSSPPYSEARIGQESGQESCGRGDQYGATAGQLGAMKADGFDVAISSPPYSDARISQEGGANKNNLRRKNDLDAYGASDGQLGAMRADGFEAAISSPPYAETEITERRHFQSRFEPDAEPGNKPQDERKNGYSAAISSPPYADSLGNEQSGIDWSKQADRRTDHSHGYNGGGYSSAVVGSPPFENSLACDVIDKDLRREFAREHGVSNAELITPIDLDKHREQGYGSTPGNMGNQAGETFWGAARKIVEQTYQVLKPGGHAVWIVKAYVKNKQIVPFPDQWRQLCEAVGFVTLHEHRAWLVEKKGAQFTLEGEEVTKTVERKSLFRRLAEKKGSPRIDFEVVYCMEKPV